MNETPRKQQVRKVRLWILGGALAVIAVLITVGVMWPKSGSGEVDTDAIATSSPVVESATPIAPDDVESTIVVANSDVAACEAASVALNDWSNDDINLLEVSAKLAQAAQLSNGAVRESLAQLSEDAAGIAAAQAVDEESVGGAMDEFSSVLDFIKAWESALTPCADVGAALPAP